MKLDQLEYGSNLNVIPIYSNENTELKLIEIESDGGNIILHFENK